jgi:hypothetical protein
VGPEIGNIETGLKNDPENKKTPKNNNENNNVAQVEEVVVSGTDPNGKSTASPPQSNYFYQFALNIGPVGGISVSALVGPDGQSFISIGPQIGKSPTLLSVSGTSNYIFGMGNATSQQINQFISGWSVTAGGGLAIGAQGTWNNVQWTPNSFGLGFFMPGQLGLSATYGFKGPSIAWPPRD